MKFYLEVTKLLFNKFILRKNTGVVVKEFSENMGIVYIKAAQILATQNYGNMFTEEDRQLLSSICDNCNPIEFIEIEKILKEQYGNKLSTIFKYIDEKPVGVASVSQVHRAILKDGKEVAIKIKRKDITSDIDKEIERIRKLIHKYGKFIKFGNYKAGDHALDFLLEWIRQETNFNQEIKNIETYRNFSSIVNNKVQNTKQITIPKLYKEYCTDDIIVMEFIDHKTINKMKLNKENNKKITEALNSYIKLSFWAMFNNEKIVFHGDPHSGNIYIDNDGNIGFLDMGLLFELNEKDSKILERFFMASYLGDCDELYNIIISYSDMDNKKKKEFKDECEKYCNLVKEKNITYYFMDMVSICFKFEVMPPDFLFAIAKAFVCLNGISIFSNNMTMAHELLGEQVIEYLLRKNIKNVLTTTSEVTKSLPNLVKNTVKYGSVEALSKEINDNDSLRMNVIDTLKSLEEIYKLLKKTNQDNKIFKYQNK